MRVQLATPNALRADEAVARVLARHGCTVPGGASADGWSGISNLQRCPYRYYLQNELRAVPNTEGDDMRAALEIGSYTHAFLAAHYIRMLPKGYPGWQQGLPGPMELIEEVEQENVDRVCFLEAKRLVYGYLEFYSPNVDRVEPVAVEYEAGIPGIHTCRYDVVVWQDGGLWDLETKTMSARADAMEGWWLDGEIVGQLYAFKLSKLAEVFGAPLTGVIINGIVKSTKPEYRRMEIVVPEKIIETYARDRAFWGQQRDTFRNRGHWPRALNGCRSVYDRCQFWAHCRDDNAELITIGKHS